MVLDLEPDEMARYWIDARIRHGEEAPRTVASSLLVRVVARLGGSIGYVPAGEALSGVKIVARIERGRVVAP